MNLIKIKKASNWLKITCFCDINNISKYKEIECMDKLIKWAMEIQSLAQNGNLGFARWMVRYNKPIYAYGICKVFVLCDIIGGEFIDNIETTETKYFSIEDLPTNLAEEKTNREQMSQLQEF